MRTPDAEDSGINSFKDVTKLHAELGELFFEHQRALLDFDFQGALDRL